MQSKQEQLTLVLGLSALHKAGNSSFSRSFSFFGLTSGSLPAGMIKRQNDHEQIWEITWQILKICLSKYTISKWKTQHKPKIYLDYWPLLVDALAGGRIVWMRRSKLLISESCREKI